MENLTENKGKNLTQKQLNNNNSNNNKKYYG